MDPVVGEWLNLVIRWVHIIVGIAWIGASFYFNWLLNRLQASRDEMVLGELWAIHAGGFFKVQKRKIPPGQLPEPLHWFRWEAYWTWFTGMALLILIYYVGANAFLIDRSVADLSAGVAITIGVATIFVGWVIYDLLWRVPAMKANPRFGALLSFVLVIAVTYGLTRVFSGRGAYIHVGAMLGSIMVANVAHVIMPSQRKLVAATEAGTEQDKALAENAELRSLHNNYITLPVLFIMLSGHYPGTYGHDYAWLILAVLFVVGVLVRHYFNVRARLGNQSPAWMLGAALVLVIGLAVATAPERVQGETVAFAEAQAIIERHCVSCHAQNPTDKNFAELAKVVKLDTPELIQKEASRILAQTVNAKIMPLGNVTSMTDKERAMLGAWIHAGARLE